jgi:hypothetical protein
MHTAAKVKAVPLRKQSFRAIRHFPEEEEQRPPSHEENSTYLVD